jgi:hypothetical protein
LYRFGYGRELDYADVAYGGYFARDCVNYLSRMLPIYVREVKWFVDFVIPMNIVDMLSM